MAGACPGFRSTKRLGVFLLPPGWDDSPVHLARRYPIIHRVEQGTVRVKCLAQEQTQCRPGLEFRPLDLETSALTIRSPRLPLLNTFHIDHISKYFEFREKYAARRRVFNSLLGVLTSRLNTVSRVWYITSAIGGVETRNLPFSRLQSYKKQVETSKCLHAFTRSARLKQGKNIFFALSLQPF